MAENLKFRNPELARNIASKIKIAAEKAGKVKICHVCGTHEWTITHYGLRSLLPENIEVIAGPGCPVCIVPACRNRRSRAARLEMGVVVTCFGDVLRVPGSKMSLLEAKAAVPMFESFTQSRMPLKWRGMSHRSSLCFLRSASKPRRLQRQWKHWGIRRKT